MPVGMVPLRQSWARHSFKSLLALERTLLSGAKEQFNQMSEERRAN